MKAAPQPSGCGVMGFPGFLVFLYMDSKVNKFLEMVPLYPNGPSQYMPYDDDVATHVDIIKNISDDAS